MLEHIASRFQTLAPAADFWSLRLVQERLCVRQGVLQPWICDHSTGALVFVVKGRGYAYAATCDLSRRGLAEMVLLMPGQTILQIHESIDHPLELDRILGDERNYTGTSFVPPRDVRPLPLWITTAQCGLRPGLPRRAGQLRF